VEESSEQINNNSEAGCGDASCGTSPLVADASSIIDMTKTPPTGKSATQNENKRKIETIAEEPSPKKIQEKVSFERIEADSGSCSSISDSGVYSAIRSSSEDQLLSPLSPQANQLSSIRDFRMSQRKKKDFSRPSVKEMWSTDTLRNESRLTTLKRNDGNRKREQQKESLREKIRQISSALNSNTHTKLPYDKQAEAQSECEKQLLVSSEEYDWLQKAVEIYQQPDISQSKGRLEISDILLKTTPTGLQDASVNHWVVGIITIADRFFATEMKKMSGLGELTANDLVLKTKQVFEDIPPNFEMEISLYSFKTVTAPPSKPRSSTLSSITGLFSKSRRSTIGTAEISMGSPNTIRKTNFKLIGSKKFDLKSTHKFESATKRVNLQSGYVDGSPDVFTKTCHFKLSPKFTSSVEYSSFLTIKLGQDQGYGAWIRYYAVMKKDAIYFWKYPEDADDGKPHENYLSLRPLLNTTIKTPKGFSLRKNTFELYADQWANAQPKDHIIGVTLDYDSNKFLRYFLAADTTSEKEKWCRGIQTILHEMRRWDPAMPNPREDNYEGY